MNVTQQGNRGPQRQTVHADGKGLFACTGEADA
jgi:hypothetical protein